MNIFIKMMKAMDASVAVSESSDEKVDKVLKDLAEYHNKAKDKLPMQFASDIDECQRRYDNLKRNLEDSFKKINQAASDAQFQDLEGAFVNVKPIIKRMEKMSPVFDGSELPKSQKNLESIKAKLREKYNGKVA